MQVEIRIEASAKEPKVVILTDEMTEEVREIVQRLSQPEPKVLAGFSGDTVKLLEQEKILRIYASGGKVFAVTEDGEYGLRLRLYEAEQRLRGDRFVRISNSEIVNLKKVRKFDLSISGTVCVCLTDGSVSYVSRRYVSKIKAVLGL